MHGVQANHGREVRPLRGGSDSAEDGIFTVSWHEGVVGADYKSAKRFTLLSRLSERAEK